MGDSACLPAYKALLSEFLQAHESELCSEHAPTWKKNPLRVLDCKRDECTRVRERAPRLVDSLCEPCREHFARVLDGLDSLGIAYVRDDFLVRGMDYYIRTTFEFASSALDAAQNAVGGGGRYDGLAAALGGPDTPGVGFGTGIERVLLAAEKEGLELDAPPIAAYVIDLTDGRAARDLTHELRRNGISADRAFDGRSMKAQMRQADRSGARLALIVGEAELDAGQVTVRVLAGEAAKRQQVVDRAHLLPTIMELLA
jgi:histidyl-tRNA synthetase